MKFSFTKKSNMGKIKNSPWYLIKYTDVLTDLEKIEVEKICHIENVPGGNDFYHKRKFKSFKQFCIYMMLNCRIDYHRSFFWQTYNVHYGSEFNDNQQ